MAAEENSSGDLVPTSKPSYPPELINKLIEQQKLDAETRIKEAEIRGRELDTQIQESQDQASTAKHLADVQLKDNNDHRAKSITYQKMKMGVIVFFGILVFAFLIYALHTNKENIALEIVKAVLYAGIGGAGGYGLGRRQSDEKKN